MGFRGELFSEVQPHRNTGTRNLVSGFSYFYLQPCRRFGITGMYIRILYPQESGVFPLSLFFAFRVSS